ncbi:unnamed protein product [Didymodactylos carnosus]|uniref:AIG1-type G domain-containing protein n=1 Tax=Didymodactylos carnosus TaxID=1234261 RepID=A0A815A5P1_9BILA|nr:unnamed protein product [Didymodactylos carnosus]CAF1347097.1 unnamed protein product [Didymodactylos carnosus]CAF4023142.1 unnamed protein product [Didymodactylos carnosus]CAF4158045.1 unnamed protein product [Didymodactylos carnosus]
MDWFISEATTKSVTEECAVGIRNFHGTELLIVDTPGLFDTNMEKKKCYREISKCLQVILPGPHAFLIVISCNRFTEEEQAAVQWIKDKFGERALSYCIVVLTRVQELIRSCGGRYFGVNNFAEPERKNEYVNNMLQMIAEMRTANGSKVFTNNMIRLMTAAVRRRSQEAHAEMVQPNGTINEIPAVTEAVVNYYQQGQ